MAEIFSCAGNAGRLIRAGTSDAAPLSISLAYGGTNVLQSIGVATRIEVAQEVSAQFQNSLSDLIFITPFGDNPGDVRIGFVSNRRCDGSWAEDNVIQRYLDYRITPEQNKEPAIITIASSAFRAFLTGMAYSAVAQDALLVQGTLTFKAWPL